MMSAKFIFEPSARTAIPVVGEQAEFPVHRIYCVGQNYRAHSLEMGGDPEREAPFFFSKPPDAVILGQAVDFPGKTQNLHHEVELVVALGSGGIDIALDNAVQCIFGYATGVDLTRRDLQFEAKTKGRPWDTAKGFDQSAPLSAIVPVAQCGHPERAVISLSVNGEQRQHADIADMIWSVPEIVAELSRYYRLCPGDLIFTGTPAGVAALSPGDRVNCEIDGIAALNFQIGNNP
jgi:fumarylpyruvate hydrolase